MHMTACSCESLLLVCAVSYPCPTHSGIGCVGGLAQARRGGGRNGGVCGD